MYDLTYNFGVYVGNSKLFCRVSNSTQYDPEDSVTSDVEVRISVISIIVGNEEYSIRIGKTDNCSDQNHVF